MSKVIARIATLFGRGSQHGGRMHASAPVTLRDPDWIVRASGWAPVGTVR